MTLDELFKHLSLKPWDKNGHVWPPDAFALCASALLKSGCYTLMVSKWPPRKSKRKQTLEEWVKYIYRIGKTWRTATPNNKTPSQILRWWKLLVANKHVPLHELSSPKNIELFNVLAQLCAAADEASAGIGLTDRADDAFEKELEDFFLQQINLSGFISTLCKNINSHHVRVLPKLHTPRSGITIRSLSHHLALCQCGEVVPQYWPAPNVLEIKDTIKLLLMPWPRQILPSNFSSCKTTSGPQLQKDFGFFRYKIPEEAKQDAILKKIYKSATKTAGVINGIVFPEMALTPKRIANFWQFLKKQKDPCFLISGTADISGGSTLDSNSAICYVPVDKRRWLDLKLRQEKHHRWRLDKSQLQQYSLNSRLPDDKQWWEASKIAPRNLQFLKLSSYAVMTFLICEDLARQDPIADLVRSIGPNIVIALLMDGPQLTSRWSSRYATVLADDPGCSVLTLTSIGMARMSKCLGKPESRVIALWKDSQKGPFEIDLPFDAEAVVLTLKLHKDTEWTADGRCEKETAGRWELESVLPVRL